MGNIGSSELLIILVLALLLLGPKRLPEVGEALGRTIKRFRQASCELRDELDADKVIGLHDDETAKPAPPPPQVPETQAREKPSEPPA